MGPDVATLPSPGEGTPGRRRIRGKGAVAVIGLAAAAVVCWLGRPVRRVEVVGESMVPTFLPGDRLVVIARLFDPRRWPRVDSVVAVVDPRDGSRLLIKRVGAADRASGGIDVRGDNPDASTDSRVFGPVPRSSLVGRVVYRYAPTGRTGPGPWSKEYHRP